MASAVMFGSIAAAPPLPGRGFQVVADVEEVAHFHASENQGQENGQDQDRIDDGSAAMSAQRVVVKVMGAYGSSPTRRCTAPA